MYKIILFLYMYMKNESFFFKFYQNNLLKTSVRWFIQFFLYLSCQYFFYRTELKNKLEKKLPPHLIIMDKVVLLGVIFLKWSVSVRHKWCPCLTIRNYKQVNLHYVYKHHTKYQSCSSNTVGGGSRTNHVSISRRTNKITKSNYLSFWEYSMKI
jgi:hypothetical protein